MSTDLTAARAAKRVVADRIVGHPAVTGVGIARLGAADFAVRVHLREAASDLDVPTEVEGVTVLVRVIGNVRSSQEEEI